MSLLFRNSGMARKGLQQMMRNSYSTGAMRQSPKVAIAQNLMRMQQLAAAKSEDEIAKINAMPLPEVVRFSPEWMFRLFFLQPNLSVFSIFDLISMSNRMIYN